MKFAIIPVNRLVTIAVGSIVVFLAKDRGFDSFGNVGLTVKVDIDYRLPSYRFDPLRLRPRNSNLSRVPLVSFGPHLGIGPGGRVISDYIGTLNGSIG